MVVALDVLTALTGHTIHEVNTLERRTCSGDADRGNHSLTIMAQNVELAGVRRIRQREPGGNATVLVFVQDSIAPIQDVIHGQVHTLVGAGMHQIPFVLRNDREIVLDVFLGQNDFSVDRVDGQQIGVSIGQHVVRRELRPAITSDRDQVISIHRDNGLGNKQPVVATELQLVSFIFGNEPVSRSGHIGDIHLTPTHFQSIPLFRGNTITGINSQSIRGVFQQIGGPGRIRTIQRNGRYVDELPIRKFCELLIRRVANNGALHRFRRHWCLLYTRNKSSCIGHSQTGKGIAVYAARVARASSFYAAR